MPRPISVLILEDKEADAELVVHELRKAGFSLDWRRVETEADYLAHLESTIDIILADYSLPQFDGLSALQLLQDRSLDIPFILVSGTIGEEFAVEAIQRGATDYMMKDRLIRLGPAVTRALEEKRLRFERKEVEEALAANDRRFRALIENSADAVALVDLEGKIIYTSPATFHVLGYQADEVAGKLALDLIDPGQTDDVLLRYDHLRSQPGSQVDGEFRCRHRDGSWRWIQAVANNMMAEPSVQALVVNFRDITGRKQAEEEREALVHELGERVRELTTIQRVSALLQEKNWDIPRLLKGIVALLPEGWQYPECAAARIRYGEWEFPSADFSDTPWRLASDFVTSDGKSGRIDLVYLEEKPAEFIGPFLTEEKKLLDSIGDILKLYLERRRADEENANLARFPAENPYPVLRVSRDGKLLYANDASILWLKAWHARVGSPVPEDWQWTVIQALESRRSNEIEFLCGNRIFMVMFAPVAESGYVNIYGRDVTDERLAQQALQTSEKRFRALIEHSSDGIVLVAPDSTVLYSGPSNLEVLGYGETELVGAQAVELIHPEDREQIIRTLADLSLHPGQVSRAQYRFRHKDGSWRWIESTATNLLAEPSVQAIVSNYRDVTERKRAEQSEHDQRVLAEALVDSAGALNSQLDFDHVLDRILENVGRVVPHDAANIMLIESDVARVVRARGYGEKDAVDRLFSMRIPRFALGGLQKPIIMGDVLLVPDTGADPNWHSINETAWVRSNLSAPIHIKGQVIGLLNLDSRTPNFFNTVHAGRLRAFADQAAMAMENARLLDETQTRARQLALLYDAGLALNSVLEPRSQLEFLSKITMEAVKAERAEFYRFDAPSRQMRLEVAVGHPAEIREKLTTLSFAVDEDRGLLGSVCRERIPLYVPDLLADPRYITIDPDLRSGLWVPVERENQLLGVIGILSTRPSAFSPHDERLLMLFANQAAVAIENARLFEETRRRLHELEAINRISTALRTCNTHEEMLPLFLDETLRTLDASSGNLALYDGSKDQLVSVLSRGWFEQLTEPLKPGQGIRGEAFAGAELFVSREFQAKANGGDTSQPALRPGWGGVAIPLRAADAKIGVLTVALQLPRELTPEEVNLLVTLADIAGNAIQRAQLHQETEQHLKRLAALHTIDVAITSSLDLRLSLDLILEHVVAQEGVDAADVFLFDPHSQMLEFASGRGFNNRDRERRRVRIGDSLTGQAALDRRRIQIQDLSRESDILRENPLFAAEQFASYLAVPLIAKGTVKGVLEIFSRTPLPSDPSLLNFLDSIGSQTAIAVETVELFNNLQRSHQELSIAYDTTIEGWSRALDLRDKETQGHTERVADTTIRLARDFGMSEQELVHVRRGALLHDIGKMGIPDSILLKPGPLTEDERAIMQKHPQYAFDLLAPVAYLRPALEIPYCHHEMWDGTGYPRRLKGEGIPLAARIFAVVDVCDALRSDRPYRDAWTDDKTLQHILCLTGKHFDPQVVEKFLALMANG